MRQVIRRTTTTNVYLHHFKHSLLQQDVRSYSCTKQVYFYVFKTRNCPLYSGRGLNKWKLVEDGVSSCFIALQTERLPFQKGLIWWKVLFRPLFLSSFSSSNYNQLYTIDIFHFPFNRAHRLFLKIKLD